MFKPSKQALTILEKRYFKDGENWEGLCKRVAKALAKNPDQEAAFYTIMVEALFLPNTPCLVNAGRENKNLSACFVLPLEDSMESIFKTLADSASVFKEGGGVGISFTTLRPEGSKVKTTNGISSGPISFMKIYDEAIAQIKAGGIRRGAAIGLLSINHPDIVKFIKSKSVNKKLTNFNISVLMTDVFMNKIEDEGEKNKPWTCYFGGKTYLIRKKDDRPICVDESKEKDKPFYTAREIWETLVDCAWLSADPGLIFINEIHRQNSQQIHAVNPCGESPLEPYEACVLGSIDVSKFMTEDNLFDFEKMMPVICTAVDFLNNVVDIGSFPLAAIEKKVKENRKIGLGIMGWADSLIKRGWKYHSDDALALAKQLMGFIYQTAKEHSKKSGYKNKALTAIAPTGSLSIIAGCSSGIEPNFGWKTITNRKDFGKQEIIHPLAKPYLDKNEKLPDYFITAHELNYENHIAVQAVFQNNGVDLGVSKTINLPNMAIKKEIYEAFKLAWKMKCKGITIYRDGCKSEQVLTVSKKDRKEVYAVKLKLSKRDSKELHDYAMKRSDEINAGIDPEKDKRNQLDQNTQVEQPAKSPNLVKSEDLDEDDRKQGIRKRPKVLFGATIKINTSSGPAYITLNEDAEGLRECLISASKAGSEVGVHTAVEGRLISNSLQYRVPIESIVQHLKNQKSSPIWESGGTVKSLPDAIAKAIEFYRKNYEGFSEYLPDEVTEAIREEKITNEPSGELCPECGENIYMEGGCDVCKSCGHSTCS